MRLEPKGSKMQVRTRVLNVMRHFMRFGLVGATNTVVGFLIYAITFHLFFGAISLGYLLALVTSYLVALPLAYFLYRKYVFLPLSTADNTFLKFLSVYASVFGLNTFVLPLAVEGFGLGPLAGQIFAVTVSAMFSYFGHRYLSFGSSGGSRSL